MRDQGLTSGGALPHLQRPGHHTDAGEFHRSGTVVETSLARERLIVLLVHPFELRGLLTLA